MPKRSLQNLHKCWPHTFHRPCHRRCRAGSWRCRSSTSDAKSRVYLPRQHLLRQVGIHARPARWASPVALVSDVCVRAHARCTNASVLHWAAATIISATILAWWRCTMILNMAWDTGTFPFTQRQSPQTHRYKRQEKSRKHSSRPLYQRRLLSTPPRAVFVTPGPRARAQTLVAPWQPSYFLGSLRESCASCAWR